FDVVDPTTTDLALTAFPSASSIAVGRNATITITVTNRGVEAAFGLTVTESLPPNLSFVSASSSAGRINSSGNQVRYLVSSLDPGKTVTMSVVARAASPATETNLIAVTFAGTDPVPDNNSIVQPIVTFL